jgi:hypothetical protein
MRPVPGAGFLSVDPGQQAEDDVGVAQFGRAADVFAAGPEFYHRRVRAAVMTAMAWPRMRNLEWRPSWPLGVSARVATLQAIWSLASACRTARLSARCPMLTAAVEYPAAVAPGAGAGGRC